jgi:hypothetical protein
MADSYEHGSEPLDSIQAREYFDKINDYQHLNKDFSLSS